MNAILNEDLKGQILNWLREDDLNRNIFYQSHLPSNSVQMVLKIKSDLILSGIHYFISTFSALGLDPKTLNGLLKYEGERLKSGYEIVSDQPIPFNIILNAERVALNLLQHSSSISTWTNLFVNKANQKGIKILDTRKTTPGLRSLEKYAVRLGGGFNHRFGQSDLWMIKDNHKSCLGGLKGAFDFFKSQGTFYQNIIAEIHSLDELQEAKLLGIQHLMLDNFSRYDLIEAIKMKTSNLTYEISGGVRLSNLEDYLLDGVDAISIGAITNSAPRVDLSLKYKLI